MAGTSLIPLKELSGLFDRLADAERRAITAELERDHLRERLAQLRAQQEEQPPALPKRSFWQRMFRGPEPGS